MNSPWKHNWLVSAVFIALLMAVSSGCAKEEVAAPQTTVPLMQAKASMAVEEPAEPGDPANGNPAPISDDGDDLGDSERSNRSRN